MNYDVHVSSIESDDLFGVEIQPPISEMAFSGLRTVLLHKIHGQLEPDATLVELTRNDIEGTAFVVERPVDTSRTAEYYAERVGHLINPCVLHEVTRHH